MLEKGNASSRKFIGIPLIKTLKRRLNYNELKKHEEGAHVYSGTQLSHLDVIILIYFGGAPGSSFQFIVSEARHLSEQYDRRNSYFLERKQVESPLGHDEIP